MHARTHRGIDTHPLLPTVTGSTVQEATDSSLGSLLLKQVIHTKTGSLK